MNTATEEIKYKEVDKLTFHMETDEKVCKALADMREMKKKIIIHYGDVKTGKDWMSRMDSIGYVSKNTKIGIPMLCETKGSSGFPILDNAIVKIITVTGTLLYR